MCHFLRQHLKKYIDPDHQIQNLDINPVLRLPNLYDMSTKGRLSTRLSVLARLCLMLVLHKNTLLRHRTKVNEEE